MCLHLVRELLYKIEWPSVRQLRIGILCSYYHSVRTLSIFFDWVDSESVGLWESDWHYFLPSQTDILPVNMLHLIWFIGFQLVVSLYTCVPYVYLLSCVLLITFCVCIFYSDVIFLLVAWPLPGVSLVGSVCSIASYPPFCCMVHIFF